MTKKCWQRNDESMTKYSLPDLTPCCLVQVYGEYLPPPCYIPIMEATGSSETAVHFYQTTQRHIPEGNNFHNHRRKTVRINCNKLCSSLIYTFNIMRRESFHVTPCQHEWILHLSRGSRINFTPVSDAQQAHHSLKMNSYERKRWLYSKHETRTI